ncbi:pyridoxamine 5'-phosphate oxidase [Tenacibaculum adriaticum]|uniref:Pyridoxamine 5'-phosphate oxidase n=1 Tax=Tenacibaculum adriaticum TaxID=413713 RepID=A0A5S5DZE2_9FLAO|nr:pyridoxamine 5'-phosphate oxidase family protein [Tenacibaculum adriaticum]TYP99909.1 pyridoxamine 5'-phosphate oxidase [Tenacibaculum adriaticum]
MSKFYDKITPRLQKFIEEQKIFFVATAPIEGRINLSPKGMDSLRVIEQNRLIWLNVTGSGNETATHVNQNGKITLMLCAFEGTPNILRIYGKAKEVKPKDKNWEELASLLPETPGARQIFDVTVESAQTSCGMSIPFYEYKGEREELNEWAIKKGKDGIEDYWKEKNTQSIDGLPTGIDV